MNVERLRLMVISVVRRFEFGFGFGFRFGFGFGLELGLGLGSNGGYDSL